jgi:hypothetical protein
MVCLEKKSVSMSSAMGVLGLELGHTRKRHRFGYPGELDVSQAAPPMGRGVEIGPTYALAGLEVNL